MGPPRDERTLSLEEGARYHLVKPLGQGTGVRRLRPAAAPHAAARRRRCLRSRRAPPPSLSPPRPTPAGSFGVVVLAEDRVTGELVAIKRMVRTRGGGHGTARSRAPLRGRGAVGGWRQAPGWRAAACSCRATSIAPRRALACPWAAAAAGGRGAGHSGVPHRTLHAAQNPACAVNPLQLPKPHPMLAAPPLPPTAAPQERAYVNPHQVRAEVLNHSQLHHPHIVGFKSVFLSARCVNIVMEVRGRARTARTACAACRACAACAECAACAACPGVCAAAAAAAGDAAPHSCMLAHTRTHPLLLTAVLVWWHAPGVCAAAAAAAREPRALVLSAAGRGH